MRARVRRWVRKQKPRAMRMETEATAGEVDWGWHWPLWLVQIGKRERDRSGVTPNPYDLLGIPETWFDDLDQMDLLDYYQNQPKRADEDDAAVKWSG